MICKDHRHKTKDLGPEEMAAQQPHESNIEFAGVGASTPGMSGYGYPRPYSPKHPPYMQKYRTMAGQLRPRSPQPLHQYVAPRTPGSPQGATNSSFVRRSGASNPRRSPIQYSRGFGSPPHRGPYGGGTHRNSSPPPP